MSTEGAWESVSGRGCPAMAGNELGTLLQCSSDTPPPRDSWEVLGGPLLE